MAFPIINNSLQSFQHRHIGPTDKEIEYMLQTIQCSSLEDLIQETIPQSILLKEEFNICKSLTESDYLLHIKELANKNKIFNSYIGQGYYNTITPSVILRNIFENPGWYTQYTPYQAEISQGRLEALINFQTMIVDLTAMEVANASLLDEGTAVAEAMGMAYRLQNKRKKGTLKTKLFVSNVCFETTIAVLKSRSEPIGIELVIGDVETANIDDSYFGVLLQYPDKTGNIVDHHDIIQSAKNVDSFVIFATDLLSLTLLKPPGELGADIVVGSSQRFGVPLGYGGPHAAYFATKKEFIREIPGRIIGISVDKAGKKAYRMTLQTREQHIKRSKATSNICTAQALLAIMAGMYAVYHGPKGLKAIAKMIHDQTQCLERALQKLGYSCLNTFYFDTLQIKIDSNSPKSLDAIKKESVSKGINFYYTKDIISISLDETTNPAKLNQILSVFSNKTNKSICHIPTLSLKFPKHLVRDSSYLDHTIFHSYHSETNMLRYIKSLENKDLSLTTSMIPLGSCTMKLNATTEMLPVTWEAFSNMHPFVPLNQVQGYIEIIESVEQYLSKITNLPGVSLQPNSGAQGEYAGLMMIRSFHQDQDEGQRNIMLIPSSAHGTNPASASMCGMDIVTIKCDQEGNIDIEYLRKTAEKNQTTLAGLMITYPSTHGVYEEDIQEICSIIHQFGGQVYMDGANMNAQVGLTNPGIIGADVCHLNLHKTFAIPHGGGGPGLGPICVAKHLIPYLPGHPLIQTGGKKAISALSSAPWSSASILLISYAYIRMLGSSGMKFATKIAILNANYIKERLSKYYPVLYLGKQGRVAHEMIIDVRNFKKLAGIEVVDIAKRLMDYGFHAPTVSFPVSGTLMIEPTESEDLKEIDRFCDAMISIRKEIEEIIQGDINKIDHVFKNAPHTISEVTSDNWEHPYSRQKAGFPTSSLYTNKFWPSVSRIDEVYGDKNLNCSH